MSTVSSRARIGVIAAVVVTALIAAGTGIWSQNGADSTSTADSTRAEGDLVPEASFELFDGSTATMADYEGRPVVVNFWASWCPPCIAEMPDLETVHQEFADEVDFLGINTQDTADAASRLAQQTGVTYDLARDPDGQLFQAFGNFGMPTTLFVSADGQIIDRHTGILTLDQARDFVRGGLSR